VVDEDDGVPDAHPDEHGAPEGLRDVGDELVIERSCRQLVCARRENERARPEMEPPLVLDEVAAREQPVRQLLHGALRRAQRNRQLGQRDPPWAQRHGLEDLGHSVDGAVRACGHQQAINSGLFGIARALHDGADIVITGRVADASLVVGPAAWWWGWSPRAYDALAGAVAAGHVIECGPQATGGNFSGFRSITDLVEPGFPIAEIAADGSSVITKDPGTGGAVTADTVTAQLLYEIGEPAYLNPDVTTHLDTAELTDLGDDRVQIRGVRGSAPPATTKVAITAVGGWENSVILALTGPDLDAKAELVERSVHRYTEAVDGVDAVAIDRIGQAQEDPDSQNAGTALLRIAVQGTKDAAGRAFSSRMVELALSSYPGLYALGPPQPGSAFGVYWPALLDQAMLDHTVHHHHGTTETIAPGNPHSASGDVSSPAEPSATPSVRDSWTDELVVASLGEIVHARSGDKGGDANLGVWVHEREGWEWLRSTLTVDELRRLLPETRDLAIARYEFPNLGAVNFLIRGLLGTGATSTLRLDAQTKALGEWLRSRSTRVPRPLVKT
jgi:Acyclic terpene utilisation family protein AtuA